MSVPLSNYTRVTDVLYPFSGLRSVPKEILRAAADRGSRVHEYIDAKLAFLGIPHLDPELAGYMQSFATWQQPSMQFMDKPERFYDDALMLTGECDSIYRDEHGITLVDFKTPMKEGKTWRLQGSAYSYMARRRGIHVDRIEFVKLSKLGAPAQSYFYEEDFDTFLKCLDVYRLFFKDECIIEDF